MFYARDIEKFDALVMTPRAQLLVNLRVQLFAQESKIHRLNEVVAKKERAIALAQSKIDDLNQRLNRVLLAFDAMEVQRPVLDGPLDKFISSSLLADLEEKIRDGKSYQRGAEVLGSFMTMLLGFKELSLDKY